MYRVGDGVGWGCGNNLMYRVGDGVII